MVRWYGGTSSIPWFVSRYHAVISRSLIDPIIAGLVIVTGRQWIHQTFSLTTSHLTSSAAKCVLAQARCWHGVDRGLMGAGGKTWGHGELWTHAIMQWVSLPLSIYTLNELLNCCCCEHSASSLASVPVSGIISGLILRLCPRQCGAARKCEM